MKRNTKSRSFTLEQEVNSTDRKSVAMPDAQEHASVCYRGVQQMHLPVRSLQNCAKKLSPLQELSTSVCKLKTHSAVLTRKSSQEQKINLAATKAKYCDHSTKRSILVPGPVQMWEACISELKYHPMALTAESSQEQNRVDCETMKNKTYNFHPYKHARFMPDNSYGMDSRIAAQSYLRLSAPSLIPRLDPRTRLPICQRAHLDLSTLNASQMARLPFSHPWFSTPMRPALSSISMPGDAPHQDRINNIGMACQCICCLGSWRASKPNLQQALGPQGEKRS